MNRLRAVRNEVQIETVHIERSDRSAEHSDIHQHLVKGLVGGELVLVHLSTPETFPVQTHVPVAKVIAHEVLDQTPCGCDVIILISRHNLLLQGIEQRDDPTVDLRPL